MLCAAHPQGQTCTGAQTTPMQKMHSLISPLRGRGGLPAVQSMPHSGKRTQATAVSGLHTSCKQHKGMRASSMSGKALNKTFKQSKSQRAPSSAKKDKAAPVQRSGVHKSTASKPAAGDQASIPAGFYRSATAQLRPSFCAPGPTPEEAEQLLRTFDLTSKYGPCTGMTRLERYSPGWPWRALARLLAQELVPACSPKPCADASLAGGSAATSLGWTHPWTSSSCWRPVHPVQTKTCGQAGHDKRHRAQQMTQ